MKSKFKLLKNADDTIIEKLSSDYCNVSRKEKDRIFAMSESKLRSMKSDITDVNNSFGKTDGEHLEVVEVEKRGAWYRPFRAAGVCFAGVIAVIGAAVLIHGIKVDNVDTFCGSVSTVDENKTAEEITIEENMTETDVAVSVSEDIDTGANDNGHIENNLDNEASTSSSAEVSSLSEEVKENFEIKTETTVPEEISPPYESYNEYDTEPDNEQSVYDDDIESYGSTTEKKILGITADMSYDEAIKALGEPETLCLINGYAQFVVDNTRLLMIYYNDRNDLIGIDGNELLASCVELSELESDPDNLTFEGYVVYCNGAVRVTCPQHISLGCADLIFSDGFDKSVIKVGDKVRISYYDEVLETFPPQIYVKEITFE